MTTNSVSLPSTMLNPGEARTLCVTKRLSNTALVHAGTIQTHVTGTWHELIVYLVDDMVEAPTPTDCQPFRSIADAARGTPITFTHAADETLTFPAGVGITLAPTQMVRIELHSWNPDTAAASVNASVTFTPMQGAFVSEAGMLLSGVLDLNVSPQQMQTVSGTVALPIGFADAGVFAVSGQTHNLGIAVTFGTGLSTLYAPTFDWSMPTVGALNPPVYFQADAGMNVSCTYNNVTGATVRYGTTAANEQCFVRSHYSPRVATHVCVRSMGSDLCCPGSPTACAGF